jgi:hypothetical protein
MKCSAMSHHHHNDVITVCTSKDQTGYNQKVQQQDCIVHPNFSSASLINILVCGLVWSQMHNISDILFSGMNSMMVIPMHQGGHQTMVTKPMQTFLYLSTSTEYVSNNAHFKCPHITSFSFTEAPPTTRTIGSQISLTI